MKSNVVIYRHQLFLPSEVFITQQAGAMQRYAPVFAGRSVLGTPPEGYAVASLDGMGTMQRVSQVLFRDPAMLAEELRPFRPALIHAHFGVEGVYALPLAKRLGIPLVTTFHGFDATTTKMALLRSRKPSWINYALLRRQLMEEGSLFVCVSDYIRRQVLKLGFPEERTVTHYIGIDVDHIQPPQAPPEGNVVLHVARLVEKKGTRYLIQAFARVLKDVPEAELVILGDGPLRHELETQAQQLGIGNRVRFLGVQPHEEVMRWMGKSKIFTLPSVTARSGDAEGLGMVHLEAGAMQVPVVATWHNGFPEVFENEGNGYLVPERDADALAQRLVCLLKDEALCRQMGAEARRVVEQKFNIINQTAKLEALYGALI